jgi:hypothetical protein
VRPDAEILRAQLGREPRGTWRVAERCEAGHPLLILVAPRLDDGSPFPTTFWLTCPRLVAAVAALESAGANARWTARISTDAALASALLAADAAYRAAREAEGGGDDPCAQVGVAGQAERLAVKCLHARVAAALGGVPDPIGAAVVSDLGGRGAIERGCTDCGRHDAVSG